MSALFRTCIRALLAAALVPASSAWSQDAPDVDLYRTYAGTYLSDCDNPASPRLSVVVGSLVFVEGDRRVTGSTFRTPLAQPSPIDARMLVAEVEGTGQIRFVVHSDGRGEYLQIEGDPAILDVIGKAGLGLQFRRCDPANPDSVSVSVSAAPSATSRTMVAGASSMIADPRFKKAYHKALGFRAREAWLANLEGAGAATRKVTIGGREYVVVRACKNRECNERNLVLLYSPQRNVVYGKIYQAGATNLIGSPPPAVARELETLWRTEWRPGS